MICLLVTFNHFGPYVRHYRTINSIVENKYNVIYEILSFLDLFGLVML